MDTLNEIAIKHKTDKSSLAHNYANIYDFYFNKIRDEELNILEIGIQSGYSLKMWKEYFCNSKIVGLDISDCTNLSEQNIKIYVGDQSDDSLLTNISDTETTNGFDIIIDDGSHRNIDMENSFNSLFPKLKIGGYYIIEDLHTCYGGGIYDLPDCHNRKSDSTFISKLKELIDVINCSGKSGYADIRNDSEYDKLDLTWMERSIEFIHFYKSICIIKKTLK